MSCFLANTKRCVALVCAAMCFFAAFSQEELPAMKAFLQRPVVVIDSTAYSVADFCWFCKKYAQLDAGAPLDFDASLDKFIEYKMKVAEAENLQLDSTKAFKEEFFKYLKMMAHDRMYAGAEKMRDDFVRLEYDRLHWDYEVAHIFVKSNVYDSPRDTLAAWQKVQKIKAELDGGKPFTACVHEYSDDNLSKELDGNVGFITAMVSPYEYEEALYKSNPGQIATARTTEGWYFIKVLGKRETKGATTAAIILVYPETEDAPGWSRAKAAIDSVHAQLQAGVPFDTLSDRYNTNERLRASHGYLGLIDNGMPYSKEIKETLFSLQNDGDYSAPLRLPYGYAIVRRLYLVGLPDFEAYRAGYEKRIASDKSRATVVDRQFEQKMKQHLHYKEYRDELEASLHYIDASILLGKWTAPALESDAVLFEMDGAKVMRSDFFQYLQAIQKNRLRDVHDKDMVARIRFDDFALRKLEIAEMQWYQKHDAEFQYAMQEYHDGMIVYDLVNREVIQTAAADSVGMRFFFNQNRENYMLDGRNVDVTFTCANEKAVKKVLQLLDRQMLWHGGAAKVKDADKIEHYEKKGTPQLYVLNAVNAKSPNLVAADVGSAILCQPEDVACIQSHCTILGTHGNTVEVRYYTLSPRLQTMQEAKEQLTYEYQKEIERKWLVDVRKRHDVQKNEAVCKELETNLSNFVTE